MGAVNVIKVNTVRLGNTADKIDEYITGIVTKLKKMQEYVVQLDQMWDGASSEEFKKAFSNDIVLASELLNKLRDFNSFELNAKKAYEECESKVSDVISWIGRK